MIQIVAAEIVPTDVVPLRELGELIVRCFTVPPWNEQWTWGEAAEYLSSFAKAGADFRLIYHEGRIVTFGMALPLENYWEGERLIQCGAAPDSYYISGFATDPSFRLHGSATAMVAHLVEHARSCGFRSVSLRTRFDNYAAIGIFSRLGFHHVGDEEASTGGVNSLRQVFVRELC